MSKDMLEDLFAAARAEPPRLPEGLAARVLEEAREAQGALAAQAPARPDGGWADRVRADRGLIGWLRQGFGFGGGGALAGMVAATVTGFYIGFAAPGAPGLLASAVIAPVLGLGGTEIDMMPGIDALLEEVP